MITDLQLHAFVDQELTAQEQHEILCEAAQCPALAARIAELQELKHLLRHAYDCPEPAARFDQDGRSVTPDRPTRHATDRRPVTA